MQISTSCEFKRLTQSNSRLQASKIALNLRQVSYSFALTPHLHLLTARPLEILLKMHQTNLSEPSQQTQSRL